MQPDGGEGLPFWHVLMGSGDRRVLHDSHALAFAGAPRGLSDKPGYRSIPINVLRRPPQGLRGWFIRASLDRGGVTKFTKRRERRKDGLHTLLDCEEEHQS
jgi:hypothetical protein